MKKFVLMLLFLSLLVVPSLACAGGSTQQAVDLVKQAVTFYKANGLEKSLDAFSDPKGPFKKGDLYVFAYDLAGTMLAHPNNTLIGQNLVGVPDPDGKLFRKEIIQIAAASGSGWVDYKYQNPKTKLMEKKTTYLEKVEEIIVCCGIFKE